MSPLTVLEGQLMKKPVIATNVGGIPELMKDEKSGFLIEKGDSSRLSILLQMILDDRKKTESMGVYGRKFVEENFSWENITKQFLKDIDNLLK